MKKNYPLNLTTIKKPALIMAITGFVLMAMSFGPMFLGPGLTLADVESFDIEVNTNFDTGGIGVPGYEVAFPNLQFDSPITFNPVPNDTKIIIGQLNGAIYSIEDDNNTTQKNLIVDWSTEVGDRNEAAVWDGGFLGLAIHPDFGADPTKNLIFVYYTTNAANNTLGGDQGFSCGQENFSGNYLLLERFRVNPGTMAFVPGSRETMIRRELYNTTHRGGGMTFGQDDFLYLTTGDQASYSTAQDIANNLDGGVLRLDVDMIGGATSHAPLRFLQDPGVGNTNPGSPGFLATEGLETSGDFYFIPNDNPYNDPLGTVFEEYYTIGHRSPHRLTMDSATGDFYIGEVGENTHEEINVLRNVPSTAGNNYGWPLWEGNAPYSPAGCTVTLYNSGPHEGPLTDFVRAEASSIIGGYVYNGSISQYQGRFIAADYATNQLFAINTQNGAKESLGVGPGQVISFGQDSSGELYMLTLDYPNPSGDSGIFRLTESIDTNAAPALLSDTGVFVTDGDGDFSDISELNVTQGFIPYEMIESFWSDGAIKRRWLAVPNDGTHNTPEEQIEWSANGDWNFPVGSVIIKQFDYPIDEAPTPTTRKIETRFSIKADNGEFYFLTYKWNAAETDATLVDMTTGDTATIDVIRNGNPETVNWLYPSNTQCIQCHNPALGGTLGPRTRFLNKDFDYAEKGGTEGNQLVTLSALGILNATITDNDTQNYLTHIAMGDPNGTIDQQARSYLDNNCAYCHQPATGNGAQFDLRLFNSMAQTGLYTAVGNTIPGFDGRQRVLIPGEAINSQLYHRANSIDPGIMMPPVAKGIVDTDGVALLEAWINQLQPPAPLPAEDTYRLVNYATKATLQVADASNDDGVNVQQGGYEGLDYQHWAFENSPELGFYYFKAESSGKFIDVAGIGPNIGVNVWQYTGNASDAQKWEIIDAGDDTFNIISKANGNYLGVEPNGNVVVGANDQNSAIFRWEFLPTSAPMVRGIAVQTNTVVTSEDETTQDIEVALKSAPASDVTLLVSVTGATDEVTLSITELTFTPADWDTSKTVTVTGVDDAFVDGDQEYSVQIAVDNTLSDVAYAGFVEIIAGINEDNDGGAGTPPTPGVYRIVNVASGLSAQVLNAGTANSVNIEQGLYQGDGHQQFELVYRENGLYSLEAVHSGKVMDVELGNPAAGTNIWQFTYDGSTPQLWSIQDAGNGTYYIISELGGHYLSIEPNGNIFVVTDNGTDNIKWLFDEVGPGITVSQDVLLTNEDGDTDMFTVVLKEAPTTPVTIGLQVIEGIGEISIDLDQLIFDATTWNVPRTVTVTSIDDQNQDGAVDFVVEAVVVAPINDPNYDSGIGDTVSGISYDNDGGNNGAPQPGIYRLLNVGNTESAMPVNGTLAISTNAVTGVYGNENYQHFELILENTGYFSIKAIGGNYVMDVQNGSQAAGANIWMYTYAGTNNVSQEWDIVGAGDGTYRIKSVINPANEYYMTADPTDGNISVNVDNGSDYFKWQFLPTGFPPVAIATASNDTGNAPLAIQFTGSTSTDDKNDIVEYLWDFGNGDTSTDADPNYSFIQGGTFNVTLTVTDGDGYEDQSEPIEIIVNGAPIAVANADIINGISALEVAFTGDQSTDAEGLLAYSWNFGDSANSTEANPIHVFANAGTYNVVLTVTDEGGLMDTDTITIVVTANMAPVAVASADVTEGRAPLEVYFIGDQSTDDDVVVSHSWDFDDGTTSLEANPVHNFVNVGTYNVVLTVTDEGGLVDTDTITIVVTANMAPVAVTSADVTQGEAPLVVSFSGNESTDDIGIVSYNWDFGDNISVSDMDAVHTYTTAGIYEAILTVTDEEGLQDTEAITITVTDGSTNMAPVAVVTANVTEGLAPLEVTFTGDQSTDDLGVSSYNWDFGDGTVSTDINPVHIFSTVGVYEVSLTVTDEGGLQDTAAISITVTDGSTNMSPVAVVSANVSEGLAPFEVTFTGDQSTDDVGITTYNWDFGDGTTSSETNPVHTFSTVGTYDVVLTVTDDGGLQDTDVITITVTDNLDNSAPVAVANADVIVGVGPLEVTFTGDESTDDFGITTYTWDFGDGTSSSEVNPQHVFEVIGVYDVMLTVTDEQGLEATANITITVTEEQPSFEFILAPNPSIEYVEVIMKDNFNMDEIIGVMMHDSAGRLIRQYMVSDVLQDGRLRIPTGSYRNEVYVITLMFSNNEPVSKRLIIQ